MFDLWWMPWLLAAIGVLGISIVVYGIMIFLEESASKRGRPANTRTDYAVSDYSYHGGLTGRLPAGYPRDSLEVEKGLKATPTDTETTATTSPYVGSQQAVAIEVEVLPPIPAGIISQKVELPTLSPVDSLCEDYNNAVQSDSYGEFRKKYKQMSTMIGLQNALDYMNDRNINPVFVAKDDGKFLGVSLNNQTLVFPKPGMTFLELDHGPGAMSRVFECGNFSKDRKYTGVLIQKPAVFTQKGSQYHLERMGALNLGKGTTR